MVNKMASVKECITKYKENVKLTVFAFIIAAMLSFVFFMFNFFICTSLCYIAIGLSILITTLIIMWPELKKRDRERKKLIKRLICGFIGAFLWIIVMITSVIVYVNDMGGPPINFYKPYKHKTVHYVRAL